MAIRDLDDLRTVAFGPESGAGARNQGHSHGPPRYLVLDPG